MCRYHEIGSNRPSRTMLTRRDALKLAIAAGIISVPVAAGGRLLLESSGRQFPNAATLITDDANQDGNSPLLILSPDDAAHAVWQEMLRVEGLPYARARPLTELTLADLDLAALAIVLPGEIAAAHVELLRDFVEAGGGLIAIQPAASLAALCGLSWRERITDDGYLRTQPGAMGVGEITGEAMQFHAPLRHYQLDGAEVVAYLCSRDGIATETPAVTYHRVGRGGVATWCYDLAASVVRTRQGPAERANLEADGIEGVRAVDMFVGFVDLDRIHLPQADEQQRLLVNLLNAVSRAPLLRLWYFPKNADSVLVCTGDSHNNPAPAVDAVLRRIEHFDGTMSVYYTPPPTSTVRRAMRRVRDWLDAQPIAGDLMPPTDVVTPYHADAWRARGHEFALHPYVEEGLEAGWAQYWRQFTGLGYGEFETTRTHRVLWHGWTDTPYVQAGYGVRMNFDYYHVGPTFRRADGSWAFGHFTGSGLPMRFVGVDGRVLDIWQQNTHLVDEQVIEMPWGANFVGSSPDAAIEFADNLIRSAVSGAYAALGAQFHLDPFAVPGPWTTGAGIYLDGVLKSCQARGVPVLAAQHWLDFARARSAIRFDGFHSAVESGQAHFVVHVNAPGVGAILLVPVQNQASLLTDLQANRKQIPIQKRVVGDTLYAIVSLDSGEATIDTRYSLSG
jgi:hypothetical protein